MTGYPLPSFTYHEALLIGEFLLHDPTVRDLYSVSAPPQGNLEEAAERLMKEDWSKYERIFQLMEEATGLFIEYLKEQRFVGTFLYDVNKETLSKKIGGLNQSQRTQLYFAIGRLFWGPDESRADALCHAGLIDEGKLPTVRLMERLDNKLLEFEKQTGIRLPFSSTRVETKK